MTLTQGLRTNSALTMLHCTFQFLGDLNLGSFNYIHIYIARSTHLHRHMHTTPSHDPLIKTKQKVLPFKSISPNAPKILAKLRQPSPPNRTTTTKVYTSQVLHKTEMKPFKRTPLENSSISFMLFHPLVFPPLHPRRRPSPRV